MGRDDHGAPTGYPAHWEADIALSDGRAAHLRPILPSDAEALQRFHLAQSEQSRYLRFFAPMPRLSPRELERFTRVDHRDRVAFVALAGDDIIAIGRYDAVGEGEAEIAFNVADAYQGKGLASVLLEHLAAAARERGIHTFVAEVLPQNHRMINVFTEAGFDVRRAFDDGIVLVEFRIDPTARSIEVMAEREHRTEARAMERLLHPASVLVVGATSSPDSLGLRVLRSLDGSGYAGAVHVVAQDEFEVHGHRTRGSIGEVPGEVDLAVLAVHPVRCLAALDECGRIGVRSVVIPSDGFADAGTSGARLQAELVARARRWGMRLLGPASFGFLRTGEDALNLSLAPRLPRTGTISLAAQSTALAAMVLSGADARGIGIREFLASGNRADVSLNDCLQHWEDDDSVSVIALALESMGNPRKFSRLARRLTRRRPVVVLRPPGIDGGAPPGHSVRSSLLPRRALDQLLDSAGVLRTRSVDEFVDVLEMLDRSPVPAGIRVGLLANSPALGKALRGAADVHDLDVVIDRRDVPLSGGPRLLERAFTGIAATGKADLVVVGVLDTLTVDLLDLVQGLGRIARGSGVPLAVCIVSDHERREPVRQAVARDPDLPPVHETPALAVRAAAGALAAHRRPVGAEELPVERPDVDAVRARDVLEQALAGSPGGPVRLDQAQVQELLQAAGLRALVPEPVADAEEAVAAASRIGYPVALKSADPVLRHRADLGGVRLDIPDAVQLRHAVDRMRRELSFSSAGLTVQAMSAPGVPVVVRSHEDPSLGPVVAFSLAGDATDLLDDIAYGTPPFTDAGVEQLISGPRSAVKLDGRAGMPPADRAALREVLIRVGLLADALPELAELELYPVIVTADGAPVIGAEATAAPAPNRTDGTRRTLFLPQLPDPAATP